jgi:hypothetical protein
VAKSRRFLAVDGKTDLLEDEAETLKTGAGLVKPLLLKEGCLVKRGVWD